jgi:hypothetical protein
MHHVRYKGWDEQHDAWLTERASRERYPESVPGLIEAFDVTVD